MTEQDPSGASDEALYVADILGDSYDSPIDLAADLSEAEIQNRIAGLSEKQLTIEAQIARLQGETLRLRNQQLIAQDALRIARDRNLE